MKKVKKNKTQEFTLFFCPRRCPMRVKVIIHPTHKAMMEWRKNKFQKDNDCEAFFAPTKREDVVTFSGDGDELWHPQDGMVGMIHFYAKAVTFAVVAHEIYHACMEWARRVGCVPMIGEISSKEKKLSTYMDHEETFAEAIGQLTGQFIVRYTELYKKAPSPEIYR